MRPLLSAIVNSKTRLDVIVAVGKTELKGDPVLLKEFEEAMKRLRACLRTRNRYAHGIYAVNGKGELCILHSEFDIPPSSKHMRVLHSHVLIKEREAASKAGDQLADVYKKLSKKRRS